MVYLLVELFNYRQLARLRQERLPEVEARLSGLCSDMQARVTKVREGASLVECGREEDLDARRCAELALQARDYLKSMRGELFGFTLLIAVHAQDEPSRVAQIMTEAAGAADKEEELWLAAEAVPLFQGYLTAEPGHGIRRAAAADAGSPQKKPEITAPAAWVRENLIQMTLEALSPRLEGSDEGRVLFLYGPAGSGKTTLIRETARRLGVGDDRAPLVRMYTLFRRRSPIHPFINSLIPSLLAEVPRHLRGPELAVWSEVGGLLTFLQGAELSSGSRAAPLFPDHLQEDFTIGYQLYLTAFIRMTAARILPAFFVCEGVESYHPYARQAVARLIGEFGKHANFIPVLSSASASIPEELAALNTVALCVHSLGKREIRSLSQALYPGIELPALEIRALKNRSRGVYPEVVSCLRYLEGTGAIRAVDGRFLWTRSPEEGPELPANQLAAAWHLMRSFPPEAFRHLYAVYLAGGLLDGNGLVSFLAQKGENPGAVERSLAGLAASGLISGEEVFVPRIPGLRRKIEAHIGREAEKLRDDLVSYMFSLWEKGEFARRVLLFSFLAKAGRTDFALRVLPEIIRRKIDERDLAAAKLFTEIDKLEFSAPFNAGQKADLALIVSAGRLRAELIEGGTERAAECFRSLPRLEHKRRGEPAGDVGLTRAVYFLSRGEASAALVELKTSLLEFQETRFERGERAAYHFIGLAMLGLGKTGEAIEYLGLSERLCGETGDALGAMRSAGALAVGLLLESRLTASLAAAERAELAAGRAMQREQEMSSGFLRAKALFLLGQYQECALQLQTCLCRAKLYSAPNAVKVMSAWLGRAMAYGGDAGSASRYLEKLPQSRETLYFLAETALLAENFRNALSYAERSLAFESASAYPPPESVSWRDGSCSIEGRCFELCRGDAYLRRGIRAVSGYLLGLRGFSREAIQELHRLTRGEDSSEADPNSYLYAYIYSLVLPEIASEEGDDKTTMLSKSVRTLQQRASRIESPSQKSAFLGLNYWNKRIMTDARARKLI